MSYRSFQKHILTESIWVSILYEISRIIQKWTPAIPNILYIVDEGQNYNYLEVVINIWKPVFAKCIRCTTIASQRSLAIKSDSMNSKKNVVQIGKKKSNIARAQTQTQSSLPIKRLQTSARARLMSIGIWILNFSFNCFDFR